MDSKQIYNSIKNFGKNNKTILEGTKVKLKYEDILEECKRSRRNKNYINFIEKYKNNIFTVEYDEFKKDNPDMVCFKEDETIPKWLFSIDELQTIKENKEE